jgi:hypothetical protein
MRALRILVAALLAGLSAGCGDDAVSTNPPPGYGTLSVYLTDGPIDFAEISNLFVTFERLYVFPVPDTIPPDSMDVAPIEVLTSPVTFDLLSLTNGLTEALGSAQIPEGHYRAIHLVLSEEGAWLVEADSDTHDVCVPSGRLKIFTDFSVSSGGVTEIILDFDAAASLILTGNGKYILRPVIRQLPGDALASSIEGDVWVETEDGLVSAGEYMVPNPRLRDRGSDYGHGDRPGDRRGRGRRFDLRPMVPLTVAWPMIVHASTPDSTGDDSTAARVQQRSLDSLDRDDLPPGDPRFHRHHPRTTMVGVDGHYKLWRLRDGATYTLRLRIHPRSGFVIVSGPDPIELNGDVVGQDFVIRPPDAPMP